jgi:hypothetical protein
MNNEAHCDSLFNYREGTSITAGSAVTEEHIGDSCGCWTLVWFNSIAKLALMLTADTWRCDMQPPDVPLGSITLCLADCQSEITLYFLRSKLQVVLANLNT